MLFAAVSRWRRCSPGSVNAAFTSAWQSSNGAVDLERANVVAPARELVLLARRHLPLREQHADANAAPPMKRRGDGAARVARGRDEDRQRPRIASSARSARSISAARKRAPTSLNAAVGPWNSSSTDELAVARRSAASAATGNRTHRGKSRRARARGRSLRRTARAPRPRSRPATRRGRRSGSKRGSSSGTNNPPSAARPRITASTRPVS